MLNFVRCFLGPRVFRLYRRGSLPGKNYESNALEHYSDGVIRTAKLSLSVLWSLGVYALPLVLSIMYRKGYFSSEGVTGLSRLFIPCGFLFFVAIFIRGVGRMLNNDYITFITTLDAYKQNRTRAARLEMTRYDFDFREWPADFSWADDVVDKGRPKRYLEKRSRGGGGILDQFRSFPFDTLSFLAMHSFGRSMIFPGSIRILNAILSPMLLKGRTKLIEDNNGQRYKLLTEEGNTIDSLFVDRRNDSSFPRGDILVICCEGNSGFYEYGITGTPLEAGYSMLGWNHPGFGSSTGVPFPSQELNAMDIVMQFALTKLEFKIENIVIYGWSIGGFSATWAAMNYPNIKGLVLDATFDDIISLAITRMPSCCRTLVVNAIRDHMNLNNAEQLINYSGPVVQIRRTKDEIISIIPSRSIQTNTGNELLVKLLRHRYPKLITNQTVWVLKEWLNGDVNHQNMLWNQQGVEESLCRATLASYIEENGFGFPLDIGDGLEDDMKIQLILYLAHKHMIDYDSSHCMPLPARVFRMPWDLSAEIPNLSHSNKKSRL